jgi:hypothetical protein
VKRQRATALIEELLQRVHAGGQYLDCIDEIWVFGSYARGALDPGDIDLAIEYTADEELWDFQIRKLASGGNWLEPLHRAVVAGRRGFQISYERRELYENKGIELTLLWHRGDRLPTALARLHAIAPDGAAGRAPREAMLPAFESIDRWVPLPIRQALVKQVQAETLSVERIDLDDAQPQDPSALRYVCDRWQERSPLRRAGLAALAHIERHGGNPQAVHLQGRDVLERDTPHFVGFRWRFYQRIPSCLTAWGGQEWIEVVNPTRTRPMHALRITPLDHQGLRHEQL